MDAIIPRAALASLDADIVAYLTAVANDPDAASCEDAAELIASHVDGVDAAKMAARIQGAREAAARESAAASVSSCGSSAAVRRRQRRRAAAAAAAATEATDAAAGPGAAAGEESSSGRRRRLLAEAASGAPAALRALGRDALELAPAEEAMALSALCPEGVPLEPLRRLLAAMARDVARTGDWLIEAMALPLAGARLMALDVAADPAAALAGTAGVSTPEAAARAAGQDATPGGAASVLAADEALCEAAGAREAARAEAEAEAEARGEEARRRVMDRYDETAVPIGPTKKSKGKDKTKRGQQDTKHMSRRQRNRARKTEVKYVEGRPVVVRAGAKFIDA